MSITTDMELTASPATPEREDYRVVHSLAIVSVIVSGIAAASLVLVQLIHWIGFGILPVLGVGLGLRAWLQIRESPDLYTGKKVALAGLGLNLVVLALGWGWQAYHIATLVPEGYDWISYSDLKLVEHNVVTDEVVLDTETIKLDGKPVAIQGYVYPGNSVSGIRQFVLCRDNGDCCFGGEPPLSDMILVTLKDPPGLTYNQLQFTVYGTLRIEAKQAMVEKQRAVIYHLEDAGFSQ